MEPGSCSIHTFVPSRRQYAARRWLYKTCVGFSHKLAGHHSAHIQLRTQYRVFVEQTCTPWTLTIHLGRAGAMLLPVRDGEEHTYRAMIQCDDNILRSSK